MAKKTNNFIEIKSKTIDNRKKSIFVTALGFKYGKKFHDVYNATLENRDELMQKIYQESKADTTISDRQKEIISKCYMSYLLAIGKNNIALPLVMYVKDKKPNLTKCLDEKRLKRIIDDYYSFMDRVGFEFECYNLFDFLKRFLNAFSKVENHKDREDATFELYVIIALAKYIRTISPVGYSQMWFVLMLMKNISLLSFVNIHLLDSNILNEVNNLIKLINIIHVLELERNGTILQTKEEKDNDEKSVILPNENIVIKNELLKEETENSEKEIKQKMNEEVLNPESIYSPIIKTDEDLQKMINNITE